MDVSDISFFFCSGEGKGESEEPGGGGGRFFIEIPRRGGLPGGWGRGRGAGRVFAGNLGGGLNIFSGPKLPPSFVGPKTSCNELLQERWENIA